MAKYSISPMTQLPSTSHRAVDKNGFITYSLFGFLVQKRAYEMGEKQKQKQKQTGNRETEREREREKLMYMQIGRLGHEDKTRQGIKKAGRQEVVKR